MYVKVKGFSGIACYVVGHPQRRVPDYVCVTDTDEETGEETVQEYLDTDFEFSEGELVNDTDRYVVVMVGDDRRHTVDVDDCEEIADDEFCLECGQMGCMHGRADDGLEDY